jgi:CRP/FNR family transcriptional regulator
MKIDYNNHSCEDCKNRAGSVFCNLKEAELLELSIHKGCFTYKKGDTIFREGTYPNGLFCMNEGKVKLVQTGNEGREQIVRLAGNADILGYRALICNDKYSSSAVALETSSVCFIPRDTFFAILSKNSDLMGKMMRLLAYDLKNAEHRIVEMAQKPVRERVAEMLLLLKETYGVEKDGKTLAVALSREELASLCGTATETTIRFISEFKQGGYIAADGKKIKILNLNGLVRTANIYD